MSAIPPSSRVFVDTNILVHAHDGSEGRRQELASELLSSLWVNRTGVVSTQVLAEFLVVTTTRFNPPFSQSKARTLVASYAEWDLVQVDTTLILDASRLCQRHSFSFWDALIVEAAKRGGADSLASEDMQNGRQIGPVLLWNPFTS